MSYPLLANFRPSCRAHRSRRHDKPRLRSRPKSGQMRRSRLTSGLLTVGAWLLAALIWTGLPALAPNGPPGSGAIAVDLQAVAAAASGPQLRLNGRTVEGAWQISSADGSIGISGSALRQQFGVDLLDTNQPDRQPIDWYSSPQTAVPVVNAWLSGSLRYLNIGMLVDRYGWQVSPQGSVLAISTPPSQISALRYGRQSWGDRLVMDLDRAAPWQVSANGSQITVTVDAALADVLARNPSFLAQPVTLRGSALKSVTLSTSGQRTTLTAEVAPSIQTYSWSLSAPDRLVLDFRPDALRPKDILWAPGLRWQQRYVTANNAAFEVYSLTVQPGPDRPRLLPIWSSPTTAAGITPLVTLAPQWDAAGAINGGYFNRNNQLPLGAVRYSDRWISGPILNRGAIAWTDDGRYVMDRLSLSQVLVAAGQTYPVLTLNSGYVQAGIARYTPDWGPSYTPLIDGEVAVTVQGDRVTAQQTLGAAGSGQVAIPPSGYLLVLRAYASAARSLAPGTQVILSDQPQPASFAGFPHAIGAGPLLIKQGQIVLNAAAEGFNTSFAQGAAPRSGLGITADGRWLLVAVQERVGGRGPTLAEMAQIMRQLGCVDALNLDGGSSTSLYLDGQLLNRSPRTAARVNNGLGIFLGPR